jgi:hypothetical protein
MELAVRDALAKAPGANALVRVRIRYGSDGCYEVVGAALMVLHWGRIP